jgi:outer membrane protein, heavy metal efflux system
MRTLIPWAATGAAVLCFTSCVAYEPRPLDLGAILGDLDRVAIAGSRPVGAARDPEAPVLTALEAAAFAVTHSPKLRARRGELGIATAELVEAGLLPNPTLSFDAMDVIASTGVEGHAGTVDFVSGLGVSWPLPRPGELVAREDGARARLDEARADVRAAEWQVVRAVLGAYAELAAADESLRLNARLLDVAGRTAERVGAARAAGGATLLQENVTALAVAALEQDALRLDGERRERLQALNELLGLPPGAAFRIEVDAELLTATAPAADLGEVVRAALHDRPDLAARLAAYESAESALRQEIARQFPSIEIGSGLAIELPFGTDFNEPAIKTAEARRARAAREVEAAVFDVRREIHAARLAYDRFQAEMDVFERRIRPRLDQNLHLLEESLRLGSTTFFEVASAQQQVIDAEQRALEVRIKRAKARIDLETIGGRWPRGLAIGASGARTAPAAGATSEEKR